MATAQRVFAALNDEVVLNLSDGVTEELLIQLIGAFTGVFQLQVSEDGGTTYVAAQVTNVNTGGAAATDMTAAGVYKLALTTLAGTHVKLKATTLSSGTPTGILRSASWS